METITVTLTMIEKLNACKQGVQYFIENFGCETTINAMIVKLINDKRYDYLIWVLDNLYYPKSSHFDKLKPADNNGRSVAHVAARYGCLPANYDQWELSDLKGWTVAHEAAKYGHLPKDFNRWELMDEDGITVAYIAAKHGHLPANFDRWELLKKC